MKFKKLSLTILATLALSSVDTHASQKRKREEPKEQERELSSAEHERQVKRKAEQLRLSSSSSAGEQEVEKKEREVKTQTSKQEVVGDVEMPPAEQSSSSSSSSSSSTSKKHVYDPKKLREFLVGKAPDDIAQYIAEFAEEETYYHDYYHIKHENGVIGFASIAISPDGTTLAAARSKGDAVDLFDLRTQGTKITTLTTTSEPKSVAFSRDGKLIAVGTDNGPIELWNTKTYTQEAPLIDTINPINTAIAAYRIIDGHRVASGPNSSLYITTNLNNDLLASAHQDGSIKLWDLTTKTLVGNLTDLPRTAKYLTFSSNGQLLAAGYARTVTLWNAPTRALITTLKVLHDIESLAFNPDGSLLAAGLSNGTIHLWNTTTTIPTPLQPLIHHENDEAVEKDFESIDAVAFRNDGKLLASGSMYGSVKLWRIPSMTLQETLDEEPSDNLKEALQEYYKKQAAGEEEEEEVYAKETYSSAITSLICTPDGNTLIENVNIAYDYEDTTIHGYLIVATRTGKTQVRKELARATAKENIRKDILKSLQDSATLEQLQAAHPKLYQRALEKHKKFLAKEPKK